MTGFDLNRLILGRAIPAKVTNSVSTPFETRSFRPQGESAVVLDTALQSQKFREDQKQRTAASSANYTGCGKS
jgi:hypothetical protein